MLQNVIIAGTFDVLHDGHKALFKKGLAEGERLMVGITSDSFALAMKNRRVGKFSDRKRAIELYLGRDAHRVTFYKLEDPFGNSVTSKKADGIAVSPETEGVAEEINGLRSKAGLPPLKILLVPIVTGRDRSRISSTRILSGEIDSRGNPALRESPGPMKKNI